MAAYNGHQPIREQDPAQHCHALESALYARKAAKAAEAHAAPQLRSKSFSGHSAELAPTGDPGRAVHAAGGELGQLQSESGPNYAASRVY